MSSRPIFQKKKSQSFLGKLSALEKSVFVPAFAALNASFLTSMAN
jgi:hypothetical protein